MCYQFYEKFDAEFPIFSKFSGKIRFTERYGTVFHTLRKSTFSV